MTRFEVASWGNRVQVQVLVGQRCAGMALTVATATSLACEVEASAQRAQPPATLSLLCRSRRALWPQLNSQRSQVHYARGGWHAGEMVVTGAGEHSLRLITGCERLPAHIIDFVSKRRGRDRT